MKDSDLQIEVIGRTPPGGQHVGVEPSHIRVTHKPTGLCASSVGERSQHRNLKVAKAMVEYGLAETGWKDE